MCSTAGVAQPKGTKRHYRTMLSITQCICAACEFNIIKYLFSISFNLLHFFSVVPHEVHETTAEYIFAFANRTQRMRLSDMYGVFSWIVLRLILRNMNKWILKLAPNISGGHIQHTPSCLCGDTCNGNEMTVVGQNRQPFISEHKVNTLFETNIAFGEQFD